MTTKTTIRIEKQQIFNPNEYPQQFQNLPIGVVVQQIEKNLQQVVNASEDSYTGLLGTVRLADGRQARVELKIDAEYVTKEVVTNNLDLFEGIAND
ncbi:MAG: hypothetical protein KGV56_05310 [Gammaproteobacteria bacterium]|nr:hypothetical protein [Gammaproteobacteria bacterium]